MSPAEPVTSRSPPGMRIGAGFSLYQLPSIINCEKLQTGHGIVESGFHFNRLRGNAMHNATESPLAETASSPALLPSSTPRYVKCLSCPDFGQSCRGYDLTSFHGIDEVRTYHKNIRKAKNIHLRPIYELARNISESTINEYFGACEKDFKWTTVVSIHNALLMLCGNRDLPPISHSCPSASSEYREQIAAADRSLAMIQAERDELRRQVEQTKADNGVAWLKRDLEFWRWLCFGLLAVVIILALHC